MSGQQESLLTFFWAMGLIHFLVQQKIKLTMLFITMSLIWLNFFRALKTRNSLFKSALSKTRMKDRAHRNYFKISGLKIVQQLQNILVDIWTGDFNITFNHSQKWMIFNKQSPQWYQTSWPLPKTRESYRGSLKKSTRMKMVESKGLRCKAMFSSLMILHRCHRRN